MKAGARLDSQRRYVLGRPGRAPVGSEAVRRFLHFYGPATSADFAAWAGLAKPHAERLWAEVEGTLSEVTVESAGPVPCATTWPSSPRRRRRRASA